MNLHLSLNAPTPWRTRFALAGMFTAIALMVSGVLVQVEYRWIEVLEVQTRAGKDARSRAVLVKTPDRPRLINTSDPYLWVRKGEFVCVSKQTLIGLRWRLYRLVLPGYCRNQPRNAPVSNERP